MLCAGEERLEDLLVRAIMSVGAARADDLVTRINSRRETWSLAATYKALRALVDNGVLVHSKGRYYIAQSWIFSLSNLIDLYLEQPLRASGGEHLLPPPGATFTWRYTDLRRLNSFASNIILVAARREKASTIYSWSPHLWFNIVQLEHERHYYAALRELGTRVIKVVGGDSPLDHETAATLPKAVVTTRFLPRKQLLPRNHYTIVVESFIITMKLKRKTAEAIDTLFERAKDLSSIDTKLLLKLFRHSADAATLTVEHSVDLAKQIQGKIVGRHIAFSKSP
jgi:hypothetical protein